MDTDTAILKALQNVGMDTTCGACMEVAFTGVTTNQHTCKRRMTTSKVHYRDIDGAYTAQPYRPNGERAEMRRWERLHGEPWSVPACELMEAEMPIGEPLTNHGPGPSLGDLDRVGHWERA